MKDIAVIGLSGKFPGGNNINELHDLLSKKKDFVTPISDEIIKARTLEVDGEYKIAGYLNDIEYFDYKLFNIPFNEAKTMDPHIRLLIESVYQCMENSGYRPSFFRGTNTQVISSTAVLEYYKHAEEYDSTLLTGNMSSYLSSTISRVFGMTGNSLVVDTQCSSGLVAINLACNSLILNESDYAIVCGANLKLFPEQNPKIDLGLDSPDGKSYAFSSKANGMSDGEAVGAVLLKLKEKAIEDKDRIYAVIKGIASNNNGDLAAGPTVPDSQAQALVIKEAWKRANIDPKDIQFIEAHGAGTELGDHIEIAGLNIAFNEFVESKHSCHISTIKSNIGHSKMVAGLVGFIKTCMSIHYKTLYPQVHFEKPSELINFEDSYVQVLTDPKEWNNSCRLAGITSLGLSGTNSHSILMGDSEIENLNKNPKNKNKHLFVFSANSLDGLKKQIDCFKNSKYMSNYNLNDISKSLITAKEHYSNRLSIIADSYTQLIDFLKNIKIEQLDKDCSLILISIPTIFHKRFYDYLYDNYPIYSNKYDEVIKQISKRGIIPNKNQSEFICQYCYYYLFEFCGFSIDGVISLGEFKSFSKVINKEKELIDSIEEIENNDLVVDRLEDRIYALLNKAKASNKKMIFIDLGIQSVLTSKLLNIINEEYIFEVGGSNKDEDVFLSTISVLYNNNFSIDYDNLGAVIDGNTITLPPYEFEKSRCWLKENNIKTTNFEELNSTQKYIVKKWKGGLDIEDVQLDESFFDLGGDSLRASKVILEINRELNIELDFEDFFDFPSPRSFAQFLFDTIDVERKILLSFNDVIDISRLSPEENIFDYGLHSLNSNAVINNINNDLGLSLNFEDIYNNPTIRLLSEHINTKLSSYNELDRFRIPIVEEKDLYEASRGQVRLWIQSNENKNIKLYNQFNALLLEGEIREGILEKSFQFVLNRHSILRTTFVFKDGKVWQKINSVDSEILLIDNISNVSKSEQKLEKIINKEANCPFDLNTDLLVRFKLIKLGENKHMFTFAMHHLISDGISIKNFTNEILEIYYCYLNDLPVELPNLSFQYKDYSAWENEFFKKPDSDYLKKYWKNKLNGNLKQISIPKDFDRKKVRDFKANKVEFSIGQNLSSKINQFCNENKITEYIFFITCVKILLYRYTGIDDVVIGTQVGGRNISGLENQIGFYAKTIPLRTKITDMPLKNIIDSVKQTVIDGIGHQLYPFDKIIEDQNIKYSLNRNPLFDVGVTFQNHEFEDNKNNTPKNDFIIKELGKELVSSITDIWYVIHYVNTEFKYTIAYDPSLYKEQSILKMTESFKIIMESTIKAPHTKPSEIDLIVDRDENQKNEVRLKLNI